MSFFGDLFGLVQRQTELGGQSTISSLFLNRWYVAVFVHALVFWFCVQHRMRGVPMFST